MNHIIQFDQLNQYVASPYKTEKEGKKITQTFQRWNRNLHNYIHMSRNEFKQLHLFQLRIGCNPQKTLNIVPRKKGETKQDKKNTYFPMMGQQTNLVAWLAGRRTLAFTGARVCGSAPRRPSLLQWNIGIVFPAANRDFFPSLPFPQITR
jgi:hypothetical protein